MLKFVPEILICSNGHTMNCESDPIIELILFVLQTLLGIFLGVVDLRRFSEGFRGLFFKFFVGVESFEKISCDAGLSGKTILLKIVKVIAERGSARDYVWNSEITVIVGGLAY